MTRAKEVADAVDREHDQSMKTRAAALSMLLIVGLFYVGMLVCSGNWLDWRQAKCTEPGFGFGNTKCTCEYDHENEIIRQRVNTATGMLFLLPAALILVRTGRPVSKVVDDRMWTLFSVCYAMSLVALAIGTMLFHGTLTFMGSWSDNVGMYMTLWCIIMYQLARLGLMPTSTGVFLTTFAVLNAFSMLFSWHYRAQRLYLFGSELVAAIVLGLYEHLFHNVNMRSSYLYAAICLYTAGQICWVSEFYLWCVPESLFQLHSVWHLTGMLAVTCVYEYYLSEQLPHAKHH